MSNKKGLSLGETVLFGMLGALMFALQVVMAPLPNIEPVSLLIMVFATVFGLKALYPVYIYVAMEVLYFGLGTWNICYFYVWPILVVAGICMKKMQSSFGWAMVRLGSGRSIAMSNTP